MMGDLTLYGRTLLAKKVYRINAQHPETIIKNTQSHLFTFLWKVKMIKAKGK